MNKIIVYLSVLLLVVGMAFAASVSRELPGRADPNSELTVSIKVSGADTSGLLTIEEVLPAGITVKDWSVSGVKEAKAAINTRVSDGKYGWSFTPSTSSPVISYKIDLKSSDVAFGTMVYFDSAGQGKVDGKTLRVAAVVCGDGRCEAPENSDSCEADCPKPTAPTKVPAAESKAAEPVNDGKMSGGILTAIIIALVVIVGIIIFMRGKSAGKKSKHKK